MSKTKKNRRKTSDSEEAKASSSDSSSEASTSEEDIKKKKKLKKSKSKRRRKKSSSSSSSSSDDSDDDSDSSDSDSGSDNSEMKRSKKRKFEKQSKGKKQKKEKQEKVKHSPDKQSEHRGREDDIRRDTEDHNNRSKWDSPSNEFEENYRDRDYDRSRYRQWDRNYDNNRNRNNNWRYNNRNRRNENYRDDRQDGNYRNYRQNDNFRVDRPNENFRNLREDRYDNDRHDNDRHDIGRYKNERENRDFDRNRNRDRERDRDRRSPDENFRKDDRERRRDRSPRRPRNFPRKSGEDNRNYKWGKDDDKEDNPPEPEDKEKPNFGLSGKLTEEANKVNGVVIKYAEPPEARKPKRRWRLYPFKGEKALATLYIHRQSCYLVGRDRKVCDLPVDHPSCSKQHAALQYRLVPFNRENGTVGKRVRPYIIDLESANGTFVNNKKIESKKYLELLEKDVIKFGFSSREYVLLHENSKEDQLDDDIPEDVPVKEEPAE